MILYTAKEKTLSGYSFIDLFCGIGGFHYALASLGAKCVFASDIDEEIQKSYYSNFKIKPKGDITKIDEANIPDHQIICAGFPCQPFSISGNQLGFKDPRGKLFFDIIRIARHHKPKVILLENVRNIENHNNGKTLKMIKRELTKIGYNTFSEVLCASDFRIPQARKRIYIVAFRNDIQSSGFHFPNKSDTFRTVEDILIRDNENSIPGTYYINRDTFFTSAEPDRVNKLVRIGHVGLGRQGERIYSIHGVSSTLSSQGGGLGGRTGMYRINGMVRKLYPRECARLMGFPDSFILSSSAEKNYKQFGNSVVVDVIQLIAREIGNVLRLDDLSKKQLPKTERAEIKNDG